MELSYSFKGLAHFLHDGEPEGIKADLVVEISTFGSEGSRNKNRQSHRP